MSTRSSGMPGKPSRMSKKRRKAWKSFPSMLSKRSIHSPGKRKNAKRRDFPWKSRRKMTISLNSKSHETYRRTAGSIEDLQPPDPVDTAFDDIPQFNARLRAPQFPIPEIRPAIPSLMTSLTGVLGPSR